MALSVGSLLGFFIPVFTANLYDEGMSNEVGRKRVRGYLINEAIGAAVVAVLTLLLWIPGHSNDSILRIIREKQRRDNPEIELESPLVRQSIKQLDHGKPKRKRSTNKVGFTDVIEIQDSEKLKHKDGQKSGVIEQIHEVEEGLLEVDSPSKIHEKDGSDTESFTQDIEQKEAEIKLEQLKLQAQQLKGKHLTLGEQIKYIFSRRIMVVIIINYSLSFGTVTAIGSLSAEIYVRMGRNEVSLTCLTSSQFQRL